jgi:thymidylate kinase
VIYILEGPDGAGKSTLANQIAAEKKASVLHCYFDPTWDIRAHHLDMLLAAQKIQPWLPVVLDRWALSELIYGTVFRGKPAYDVLKLMNTSLDWFETTWIYCRTDSVIEDHRRNQETRHEIFDDMTKVVEMYDDFIAHDELRDWVKYDFYKDNMAEFVAALPGENYITREVTT